eukprot:14641423-Alexandrium_andersonii.AAC.1
MPVASSSVPERPMPSRPVAPVVRGRGLRLYKRPSGAGLYADAPDYDPAPDYDLGTGVKSTDLGLADTGGLETIYGHRGRPTG